MSEIKFFETKMKGLIEAAHKSRGSTGVNPPVAAAALTKEGKMIGIGIHAGPGQPHAEVLAVNQAQMTGQEIHTLMVTLEPCSHTDKQTPPCADFVKKSAIKRLVYATLDPNPKVNGRGIQRLRDSGVEIIGPVCEKEARYIIRPFEKWIKKSEPYITVKRALNQENSMIPPAGQKTFTRATSLEAAHGLRKRAGAVLTGSGTILSDSPLFTVRNIEDFSKKQRTLFVLDRRKQVPTEYIDRQKRLGFNVVLVNEIKEAIEFSKANLITEILVEAGPMLTGSFEKSGQWDEWVDFRSSKQNDEMIINLKTEGGNVYRYN